MNEMLGRSIVLVGIMDTGRSTVGHPLAAAPGCPFSDVDPEMERRDGLPVRSTPIETRAA